MKKSIAITMAALIGCAAFSLPVSGQTAAVRTVISSGGSAQPTGTGTTGADTGGTGSGATGTGAAGDTGAGSAGTGSTGGSTGAGSTGGTTDAGSTGGTTGAGSTGGTGTGSTGGSTTGTHSTTGTGSTTGDASQAIERLADEISQAVYVRMMENFGLQDNGSDANRTAVSATAADGEIILMIKLNEEEMKGFYLTPFASSGASAENMQK